MPSTRSKLKLYKENLHLSPKIQEIGLGVVLGDASLQNQDNGKTYRLKFEGGDKNRAYIQHLREVRTHPLVFVRHNLKNTYTSKHRERDY